MSLQDSVQQSKKGGNTLSDEEADATTTQVESNDTNGAEGVHARERSEHTTGNNAEPAEEPETNHSRWSSDSDEEDDSPAAHPAASAAHPEVSAAYQELSAAYPELSAASSAVSWAEDSIRRPSWKTEGVDLHGPRATRRRYRVPLDPSPMRLTTSIDDASSERSKSPSSVYSDDASGGKGAADSKHNASPISNSMDSNAAYENLISDYVDEGDIETSPIEESAADNTTAPDTSRQTMENTAPRAKEKFKWADEDFEMAETFAQTNNFAMTYTGNGTVDRGEDQDHAGRSQYDSTDDSLSTENEAAKEQTPPHLQDPYDSTDYSLNTDNVSAEEQRVLNLQVSSHTAERSQSRQGHRDIATEAEPNDGTNLMSNDEMPNDQGILDAYGNQILPDSPVPSDGSVDSVTGESWDEMQDGYDEYERRREAYMDHPRDERKDIGEFSGDLSVPRTIPRTQDEIDEQMRRNQADLLLQAYEQSGDSAHERAALLRTDPQAWNDRLRAGFFYYKFKARRNQKDAVRFYESWKTAQKEANDYESWGDGLEKNLDEISEKLHDQERLNEEQRNDWHDGVQRLHSQFRSDEGHILPRKAVRWTNLEHAASYIAQWINESTSREREPQEQPLTQERASQFLRDGLATFDQLIENIKDEGYPLSPMLFAGDLISSRQFRIDGCENPEILYAAHVPPNAAKPLQIILSEVDILANSIRDLESKLSECQVRCEKQQRLETSRDVDIADRDAQIEGLNGIVQKLQEKLESRQQMPDVQPNSDSSSAQSSKWHDAQPAPLPPQAVGPIEHTDAPVEPRPPHWAQREKRLRDTEAYKQAARQFLQRRQQEEAAQEQERQMRSAYLTDLLGHGLPAYVPVENRWRIS